METTLTPDFILDSLCIYFGVHPRAIKGSFRSPFMLDTRQVIVYFLLKQTPLNFTEIALLLNKTEVHVIALYKQHKLEMRNLDYAKKISMAESHLAKMHSLQKEIDIELIET